MNCEILLKKKKKKKKNTTGGQLPTSKEPKKSDLKQPMFLLN